MPDAGIAKLAVPDSLRTNNYGWRRTVEARPAPTGAPKPETSGAAGVPRSGRGHDEAITSGYQRPIGQASVALPRRKQRPVLPQGLVAVHTSAVVASESASA